ncbi:MAG TPA: hypothetical protein HPQ04_12900 [Rhodospirillaceae bacterium]|nr:hypothetical protein [Rhodospirillaceae bacterium]
MKRLAVLALAGLLAACVGQPQSSSTAYRPYKTTATADPAAQARPAAPPTVADLGADPDRFRGLSSQEVTGFLGEPSFRRREKPAEIWQYYGQGCVLDLFLYDDNAVKRVSHAELRGQPSCLPRLLEGHKG